MRVGFRLFSDEKYARVVPHSGKALGYDFPEQKGCWEWWWCDLNSSKGSDMSTPSPLRSREYPIGLFRVGVSAAIQSPFRDAFQIMNLGVRNTWESRNAFQGASQDESRFMTVIGTLLLHTAATNIECLRSLRSQYPSHTPSAKPQKTFWLFGPFGRFSGCRQPQQVYKSTRIIINLCIMKIWCVLPVRVGFVMTIRHDPCKVGHPEDFFGYCTGHNV